MANYDGHQSINLSMALRDPSMVREVLSYEIARDYMASPLANFAQLKINDKPYGLMINIEAIDDNFLKINLVVQKDLYSKSMNLML